MHAQVTEGRQHVEAGAHFAHHRHEGAYAAIVLSGGYDEAGERGRWHVRAGDVVIHDMFDAHCDRFRGACEILNLHLPAAAVPSFAFGHVKRFVVHDVAKDSPAADAGLRSNDEIVAINGQPASAFTIAQFNTMLTHDGTTLILSVRADGSLRPVTLHLRKRL